MRILVAIGGNALTDENSWDTAQLDQNKIDAVARTLIELEKEHTLIVTHGNGPQVGWLAMQEIRSNLSFDMLDAQSEGMLGYRLAQAMDNYRNCPRTVTLLTRVEVDRLDTALSNPTKPVGPVISNEQASRLSDLYDWKFIDVIQGKRRVVPSPRPVRVMEDDAIRYLMQQGYTVICAGGGGIPVAQDDELSFHGIGGVIDKDYTSALLASELALDALLLLTNVNAVYIDWATSAARAIRRINCYELGRHHLMQGTMGPKVEAACDFVTETGGFSCIGKLTEAHALLQGEAGTRIVAGDSPIEWW